MNLLFSLLVRLAILAAGLLAAAVIATVLAALLAFWLLRTAWSRLTGRPMAPFVVHMRPGHAFGAMMRHAPAAAGRRHPRADAAAGGRARLADVTDVEPK